MFATYATATIATTIVVASTSVASSNYTIENTVVVDTVPQSPSPYVSSVVAPPSTPLIPDPPIEQDETNQEDKEQAFEDPFAASDKLNKPVDLVGGSDLSIVLSGLEFSKDGSTLPKDFEGINQAWSGGLDALEFVDSKKVAKPEGLGGLEL
ncbi:hypothetical protein L1987_70341 [Smallanthus sonchifolius]|uniref:Uncharacterized protein n=1 Tax=Smallanthus sonchifolius TaxID=185202 RepID=A0ACB9AQ86_9ASTR|nr:hypothetical protein L1987_70341 [Smallanthus sonchifolius]